MTTTEFCHETRVLGDLVNNGLRFRSAEFWIVGACRRIQAAIPAHSNPSKVNWSTARLMTAAASVDNGVQPALRGHAARRAREEHDVLDMLRGRAAGIPLGSGGGAVGIDTGADDGTSKSSTGGQKGCGAAVVGRNLGIPVSATFWVNASRAIPLLTFTNVKTIAYIFCENI